MDVIPQQSVTVIRQGAKQALYLPARIRFGEGREETSRRSLLGMEVREGPFFSQWR